MNMQVKKFEHLRDDEKNKGRFLDIKAGVGVKLCDGWSTDAVFRFVCRFRKLL